MRSFERWLDDFAAPQPDLDEPLMKLKCCICNAWIELPFTEEEFDSLPRHKQEGAVYCYNGSSCCP